MKVRSVLTLARNRGVYNFLFRGLSERLGNSQFVDEYQTHHITTSRFQKCLLTAGSSLVSLLNPARGGN
jgi:hypothetical protein